MYKQCFYTFICFCSCYKANFLLENVLWIPFHLNFFSHDRFPNLLFKFCVLIPPFTFECSYVMQTKDKMD